MQLLSRIIIGLLVIAIVTLSSGSANATPSAEFKYVETNLGGGLWQYDYTLFNTSDPVNDSGFDIYYVYFEFNNSYTLTVMSIPAGWDSNAGFGFGEIHSDDPGLPPAGADIAPGTSLSDFCFEFNYQAGDLYFEATLTNPDETWHPIVFSGTSVPVPIPSTILLLVTGIVGMGVYGRKRLRN